MLVHPSFPAKSVPEFITHAKANPGRIGFGSAGIGSTLHLAGEQFNVLGRFSTLRAQAVWKGFRIGTNLSAMPVLRSLSANLRRIVP